MEEMFFLYYTFKGNLETPNFNPILAKLQEEEDHPGPIFLRNVTTGHRPYKMIVAFVTVFIALMIIVVISVVYSNS